MYAPKLTAILLVSASTINSRLATTPQRSSSRFKPSVKLDRRDQQMTTTITSTILNTASPRWTLVSREPLLSTSGGRHSGSRPAWNRLLVRLLRLGLGVRQFRFNGLLQSLCVRLGLYRRRLLRFRLATRFSVLGLARHLTCSCGFASMKTHSLAISY